MSQGLYLFTVKIRMAIGICLIIGQFQAFHRFHLIYQITFTLINGLILPLTQLQLALASTVRLPIGDLGGFITTLMRHPAVAPDDSPFWSYERYVHTIDSGTIYHTWDWDGNSMSTTFGTYSTETLCNDDSGISNPNFITAVTVIPATIQSDSVQSIESNITIVDSHGDPVMVCILPLMDPLMEYLKAEKTLTITLGNYF